MFPLQLKLCVLGPMLPPFWVHLLTYIEHGSWEWIKAFIDFRSPLKCCTSAKLARWFCSESYQLFYCLVATAFLLNESFASSFLMGTVMARSPISPNNNKYKQRIFVSFAEFIILFCYITRNMQKNHIQSINNHIPLIFPIQILKCSIVV